MGDNRKDGEETTHSKFVDIAYRQSSVISGTNLTPAPTEKLPAESNYACTTRLKNLPIISGVTSSVSEAYDSLKKNNATVESILTATEGQLQEGAKLFSPVTSTLGNVLEKPLKSIDSAICEGIDYLEEKVPLLKDSTVHYSNTVISTIKGTLENLGKVKKSSDESEEDPKK